jgi:excisionase family DNA binding protein
VSKQAPPLSHSTSEAAELLGVSIPTIQRWVDAGRLKAWKTPGGHRRVDAASAEDLRLSMRVEESRPAASQKGSPSAVSAVIVDDNPDDLDVLQAIVEAALPGVSVRTYASGIQALVAIGRHAPSIFITDILMPHLDGVEVLKQLASQCEVRPELVLAVSSKFDAAGRPGHDIPEGVHFFPKPVDHRAMVTLLKAVFARPAAGSNAR